MANQTNQETANTLLNDIKNLVPIFTFSDSRLNVATGLNQPLTLAQLQEIIVATKEQDPLDISELAKQTTLEALLNKIALEGDRIKVDVGTGQGLTNDQLRAQPVPIIFDLSSLATKTNQDATNTRLGDIAESPPSTDTASSGINGRLVRLLQRLTTLIGLFPPSLGAKTAANSLAVTLATDGVASGIANQIGEVQTTPTANTVLDRLRTIATLLSGTIRNSPIAASTPTLTNVASSANSVTLLASNSNRKTAIIVNDSTSILYIKFDASAASTTSYSLVLPPITNSIPSFVTISGSDYAGEIRGIWASANGFARITEVV